MSPAAARVPESAAAVPLSGARASRGTVRTGVVLPLFSDTPDEAIAIARRADEIGIDGVFCHDHLWPLGQPCRPALAPFPVLGAVASATSRVAVGTLVARVGLVPDAVLLSQFSTLTFLAPGRVVAGLGTGDRLSAPENLAYGVPFPPASVRRSALEACARALAAVGIPVWVGGGAPLTTAVAGRTGAAVNLWAADPAEVATQAARTEVTWAGPTPGGDAGADGAVRALVDRLASAGASWVVLGWPAPLDALAAAGAGQRGD